MEQSEENDVRLRRVVEGRTLVSRAWVMRYTGAGRSTVARWYALRHEQPEGRRHPERVVTVDRVDYYDQAAVEAFWAAYREGVGTARVGVSGRRSGARHGTRPWEGVRCPSSALRPSRSPSRNCAGPGGHQRGLAARLARAHGGGASTWERAVTDARAAYATEVGEDEREAQRPASE